MRLTELVEEMCERGLELESRNINPVVVVHFYVDGQLEPIIREVELVLADVDGNVVLHCPRPE
jgi:hypothetical protein